MNYLDTTLIGGMPLELDDLEWEQNAIRQGFEGVCSMFSKNMNSGNVESYVLSGCVIQITSPGGVVTPIVTPGWVWIRGAGLLCFEGVTLSQSDVFETLYLDVETSDDPAGAEVFEDLVTRNAYKKRIAVLRRTVSSSPSPDAWFFETGHRLIDRVQQLSPPPPPVPPTPTPTAFAQPVAGSSFSTSNLVYRKMPDGTVQFRGYVTPTTAIAANTLVHAFDLPNGFGPWSSDFRAVLVCNDNTPATKLVQVVMYITSGGGGGVMAGVWLLFSAAAASGDKIDFTALSYFAPGG